jgi:hypothetical protein
MGLVQKYKGINMSLEAIVNTRIMEEATPAVRPEVIIRKKSINPKTSDDEVFENPLD